MESGIQSSFIPRDAAQPTPIPRERKGGLQELILLVGIVLLVASVALTGAVFLYTQYIQSSATSKQAQLQRAKEAFEPTLIQEITRLDDRMRAADLVLTSHIAPIALFDALQQSTLATVAFDSMTFEAPDAQHMTLKMSGVAQGVNSIALQGDLFSKNGVITNPIFADINRQVDGVHFRVNAIVNPAAVNYVQLLGAAQASIQSQAQTQQQVQTQSSPFQGTQQTATTTVQTQQVPQQGASLPSGDAAQGAAQ